MGDFLSGSSGLGYAGEALLIVGALAILVALMKVPAVPNVLLFWIAFVLTRPLGATAGDFLTKPIAKVGLDLGTAGSSTLLLAVLFGLMPTPTCKNAGPPLTLQPGAKVYSAVNLFDYGSGHRTEDSFSLALRGPDGQAGPSNSVALKGEKLQFSWNEADMLNWSAQKPYDF